jgi:hypothetical protein
MEKWFLGLGFSIIVGHFVTASFLVFLRRYTEKRAKKDKRIYKRKIICAYLGLAYYPPLHPSERQVSPIIVGILERTFFTIIIACNISGGAVAMIGWITLKMLTSRKYREERAKAEGAPTALVFESAGLLGNLISMFFALIGGLIIQWNP